MTKEEKQLLLKDLCGRLPYGVKVHVINDGFYDMREPYDTTLSFTSASLIKDFQRESGPDAIILQPYLHPMSSMTEEEMEKCRIERGRDLAGECGCESDYLNSIHIDYRGLIPMGLALKAPEGMYK